MLAAVMNTKSRDGVALQAPGGSRQANICAVQMKSRQVLIEFEPRGLSQNENDLIERLDRFRDFQGMPDHGLAWGVEVPETVAILFQPPASKYAPVWITLGQSLERTFKFG